MAYKALDAAQVGVYLRFHERWRVGEEYARLDGVGLSNPNLVADEGGAEEGGGNVEAGKPRPRVVQLESEDRQDFGPLEAVLRG